MVYILSRNNDTDTPYLGGTFGKGVDMDTPLRRWRIAEGLTQAEAGELIGVKHAAFSRYERGARIPYRVLQKLREQTKLSYDALLQPALYLEKYPHIHA